ncbi:serine protease inhibitor 3/4-like [Zerene cesonia]|uniref:serine protease inhibitor 3/4-like n=1 Tax=Zerene cesonia TaxID=33412 RepID=UPI0018E4EE7E|nr:serine protease inhibitor 3/4-like [Zerene cesonia]
MKMFLLLLFQIIIFADVKSQTNNQHHNGFTQENIDPQISYPDQNYRLNQYAQGNGVYPYENLINRFSALDQDSVPSLGSRNGEVAFMELQSQVSKPSVLQNVAPQQELLNNVSHGVTDLGIKLLRSAMQLQPGNIMMSPTSIATLLALLQQGTSGAAQEQITNSLHMAPEITAPIYRRLTIDMRKRNSRNILTVANNVVVADSFDLNPAFKTTAIRNFGSEVTPMNFASSEEAAKKINKWVADNTKNRITDMLPPEIFNPNTQLVLVNVVYFKGLWETKFKPEATMPREFHLSNGQSVIVPFMRLQTSFKFGEDAKTNSIVCILPFERYQYSLILILPNEGSSTESLIDKLTDDDVINYHKMSPVDMQIEIPKFTMKSDTNLQPVLKQMGVKNIFDSQSELAGIGIYRTYPPQISDALHSGYLSIDEQGATAAAASAFAAVALSFEDPLPTFRANRPFVAILWDTQFAIPLFMARIDDPSILK